MTTRHRNRLANWNEATRTTILLRAAYDLIKRSTQSWEVEEASSILVRYDDAICDGYCLMEDIANEIGLEEDADPISLESNYEVTP